MTQGYKMTTSTHSARRARARYEKHKANLRRQTVITDFDYQSSLSRRLHAVHSLYYEACASMDLEQVNRVVVPGVLPIAFSLVHQLLIEDGSVVFLGGPVPQMSEAWATRMGLAINDPGKDKSVTEMMGQRIGDYGAFLDFQRLAYEATEHFVGLSGMTF